MEKHLRLLWQLWLIWEKKSHFLLCTWSNDLLEDHQHPLGNKQKTQFRWCLALISLWVCGWSSRVGLMETWALPRDLSSRTSMKWFVKEERQKDHDFKEQGPQGLTSLEDLFRWVSWWAERLELESKWFWQRGKVEVTKRPGLQEKFISSIQEVKEQMLADESSSVDKNCVLLFMSSSTDCRSEGNQVTELLHWFS